MEVQQLGDECIKKRIPSAILIAVTLSILLFAPAFAGGSPGGYCETILGGTWIGPNIFTCKCVFLQNNRQTNPICSLVDLPRSIENSAIQPISFKGNNLIESASLAVPGGDNMPIFNLTYDVESHTWSGNVNTLYLPAGYYAPVRVLVDGEDTDTRACHRGGLTVE